MPGWRCVIKFCSEATGVQAPVAAELFIRQYLDVVAQLFFEQVKEDLKAHEKVIESAQANDLENFGLFFRKLIQTGETSRLT